MCIIKQYLSPSSGLWRELGVKNNFAVDNLNLSLVVMAVPSALKKNTQIKLLLISKENVFKLVPSWVAAAPGGCRAVQLLHVQVFLA